MRIGLIVVVSILWLICFSALFAKDKRKAKLRYIEKQRQTVEFQEKRTHPRISYPMFVLYRVLGSAGKPEAMLTANARNLSETGILLEIKQDLPIGTQLELKLELGPAAGSIIMPAVVVRKEWIKTHGLYATGLAIDIKQDEQRQRLAHFIEQEHIKEEIG